MPAQPTLIRLVQVGAHYGGVKLSRSLNRNLCGPFLVYVEVTKKCNLRCQFCDIWRAKDETVGELTREELFALADDLEDLGTKAVALFGGEAMLRPDLFDVIAAMKRAGLHVTLDTNGYLLPQFHRQVLDSRLDMLVISLDGSREAVADRLRGLAGNFRRTLEGLRLVVPRRGRLKVVVNTLIMRDNFRELIETIRVAEDLGVQHFRLLAVNAIYPYNMLGQQAAGLIPEPHEIDELRDRIEEAIAYCAARGLSLNPPEFLRRIPDFYGGRVEPVNCYSGFASLNIWNDGRIGYCVGLPHGVGNIRDGGLARIWRSRAFAEQRARELSGLCDKCYVACHMETNYWFRPAHVLGHALGLE